MIGPLRAERIPPALQNLSPPQARFCLNIARFVENDLETSLAGQRVLVGFSGGADSTSLLLALHYLSSVKGFGLFAAHLDHQLRPSSGSEAASCQKFCAALDIHCVTLRKDIASLRERSKTGAEEAGREVRHAFFAATAKQLDCDWIALGHTLNDLAEDVLMRLIRGAGWPGLAGMAGVDRPRRLLKPLLLTPRSEVETFLTGLGVEWVTDESNHDEQYFRNRVRGRILPLFLTENPSFLDRIAGLWRLGRIDSNFFEQLLPCVVPDSPVHRDAARPENSLFLSREQLSPLPKAMRLRLYKKAIDALGTGQARVPGLLSLDAAWLARGEPTTHKFPGGKQARVTREGIFWGIEKK